MCLVISEELGVKWKINIFSRKCNEKFCLQNAHHFAKDSENWEND